VNNILALAQLVIKELYRRKDFYVLLILTVLITLLLGTINVFNDSQIVGYVKQACLLLVWISSLVIALATTARQIPAERENRTIFPLLAKPVTRAQVILGKFLGCWLACGIALVVFYLFFSLLSASREHELPVLNYLQAMWLHWWMLAIVIAMTLLGSVVFTAVSSNVTITFLVVGGILFVGRDLHKVASRLPEPSQTLLSIVYFAMPHLEFFDVRDLIIRASAWGLIPWGPCGLATLYALAYTSLFLLATWLVFRRQTLN
jgi:ABC-type transport system involved in multi-copper enzyme maturation permease subunit